MSDRSRRLRIGLSSCFFHSDPNRPIFKGKTLLYVEQSMTHWINASGALVYPIPTISPNNSSITVEDIVADLDGLVLHGGSDVCPRTYGEEPLEPAWEGDEVRDLYEIELVRAFNDAKKPIFGVCRGMQLLNVAFGGTLYQDIGTQVKTKRVHRSHELYENNKHLIDLDPASTLGKMYPEFSRVQVNSIHHQAVKDLGEGLVVQARSVDEGIIEAVRVVDDEDTYIVGVQWHPEFVDYSDPAMFDDRKLLFEFLTCAADYAGIDKSFLADFPRVEMPKQEEVSELWDQTALPLHPPTLF